MTWLDVAAALPALVGIYLVGVATGYLIGRNR